MFTLLQIFGQKAQQKNFNGTNVIIPKMATGEINT